MSSQIVVCADLVMFFVIYYRNLRTLSNSNLILANLRKITSKMIRAIIQSWNDIVRKDFRRIGLYIRWKKTGSNYFQDWHRILGFGSVKTSWVEWAKHQLAPMPTVGRFTEFVKIYCISNCSNYFNFSWKFLFYFSF